MPDASGDPLARRAAQAGRRPPAPPTTAATVRPDAGRAWAWCSAISAPSPLYALRQTVLATEGGLPNHVAVMGSLSMIFWALILVVTVKYVLIIMRADNNGEGGTLALAALAHRSPGMTRADQGHHRHRRHCRPGAVLRRRHADAGHHRAVGGGRPEGGKQRFRAAGGAADAGHPDRPVRCSRAAAPTRSAGCSGR